MSVHDALCVTAWRRGRASGGENPKARGKDQGDELDSCLRFVHLCAYGARRHAKLLPVRESGLCTTGKRKKLEFLVRTMLRHFASTIKRGGLTLSKRPVANGGIVRTAHRPRTTLVMASQEGQIQSELMESMRSKIQTALDAQSVSVSDVQGDGRHVEIVVVSSQFEGQNSVNRQRMVYKAIWEELQDVVHAVRLSSSSSHNKTGTLVLSHVIASLAHRTHPHPYPQVDSMVCKTPNE